MQYSKLPEREILKVENLNILRNNKTILKNVNFLLHQSEIAVITGESGSGKSTFLKSLNALIPVSKGDILFKNSNILEISPSHLRRKICLIPQIPVAIAKNVFDEFKLIKNNIEKSEIDEIVEKFKLDPSILYKNFKNLSIGQQQRISIIRGLINEPEIMLLDEPTSALDNDNIDILENIIKNINKELNMSFIIVTHNIEFAKNLTSVFYRLKQMQLEKINGL